MDILSPSHLLFLVAGGLLGVAAHLGVFIRGEWHIQAPQLVIGHACVVLCVALCRLFLRDFDSARPIPLVDGLTWACLAYPPGLFTSIVIYRVSGYHRLSAAGFPGPFGARVTKLWHVWACRYSKNHEVLDRLHQEYGEFVRTGESWTFSFPTCIVPSSGVVRGWASMLASRPDHLLTTVDRLSRPQ